MSQFKSKKEAEDYLKRFLTLTKSLWARGALPTSVGNQWLKNPAYGIGSDGKLNEWGNTVVSSIEASGEKMPVKFFRAISVIAGGIDLGKLKIQERIKSWTNKTRNALLADYEQRAVQSGQGRGAARSMLVNDLRWQSVEELRIKNNPAILFETYRQGRFPEAQGAIPDLLELFPSYKQANIPSSSPPPPADAANQLQSSALPAYKPSSDINYGLIITGLVLAAGGFYYAKKNKLI